MNSNSFDVVWTAYELPQEERPGDDSLAASPQPSQSGESILFQNENWFCSLRWLVIGALAVMALAGWITANNFPVPGLRLDWDWPLAIAGVLIVLNVIYLVIVRKASQNVRRATMEARGLWLQIVLDLAVLTVVVHFLGSLGTFAPFMYLFHIVLACIFLPYAQSLLVTLIAMGMYLACLLLESTGVVAWHSMLAVPPLIERGAVTPAVEAWQFSSVAFVSATVWYLASRLSNALRRRDEELSDINRRLVAATDERAGHLLRTTHQLKAPFAAIHANTQLLLGGHCGMLPGAAVGVIEQIASRCEMLSRGIKSMLQLANLRSQSQNPPSPVAADLSAIVEACVAALQPQASKRGIAFEADLSPAVVTVVPDHAVMILENILYNAVSYSRDGQKVEVTSRATPDGGAQVVIRDRGIGILPDKLPRIFEDYFRTTEAVKHNRASTGLGLAIVRQSALTGKIGVRVESAADVGTVFSLDFPKSPT